MKPCAMAALSLPRKSGAFPHAKRSEPPKRWKSSSVAKVVALYVESKSHYYALGADCYDAKRDARTYAGNLPVVAHPPCGPWGRLAHQCTKDDPELAILAVAQVRRCGGVLEHPATSRLWAHLVLPPADSLFPDEFGGRTYLINQGDYGHRAPKATFLYAVGLPPCPFVLPTGFDPGGRVQLMGSPERRRTPLLLAQKLVTWAAQVRA